MSIDNNISKIDSFKMPYLKLQPIFFMSNLNKYSKHNHIYFPSLLYHSL